MKKKSGENKSKQMNLKSKKSIEFVDLNDLLLDDENPRFSGLPDKSSQLDIAKYLWEDTHLDELLLSIAVNGYYSQEPLLVIANGKKYTVVEGNRRLASVKILTDQRYAKHVAVRASDMPTVTPEVQKTLETLPIIKYESRRQLWSYLSFRHVNGPRSWPPISKAEFIANLYENMKISFEDILKSTGDKNRTSIKMYNALMVLRQGEDKTRFKRTDFNASKFNFSHLYTIIQYPDTKSFLGISQLDPLTPFPKDPVPLKKNKELEELLMWIFGSKSQKTLGLIKSQNPDLRMLDDIIGNADALSYLREERSLLEAHEYTKKEDRRLETYIIRAERNLRKAKSVEDAYKGDDLLLDKISTIHTISGEMKAKMREIHRKS